MPTEPRLPANIQRLLNHLKNGHHLCMSLRQSEAGEERKYWLDPANRPVGRRTVERALGMGLIKPNGDSLFDDGSSQTYSAVS